jgi:hypothetical protein
MQDNKGKSENSKMDGSTSGSSGNNDKNEDEEDVPNCGYHHCPENTIDVFDAYELGWQNFGQSWSITTNSNSTWQQRFLASSYITFWGGAHVAFAAGFTGLTCAALVTGCAAVGGTSPIWIQGFARGGPQWHVGLETVKNMNIIHVGRHIEYGVHIALGAIKPFAANLHIYLKNSFPFFRIWKP